jgi:hypothetical protein
MVLLEMGFVDAAIQYSDFSCQCNSASFTSRVTSEFKLLPGFHVHRPG